MLDENVAATDAARMFKVLLEMGLGINARNRHGGTALQVYMSTGWETEYTEEDNVFGHDNEEIRYIFKRFHADWKTTDDKGSGLLHVLAATKGRYNQYGRYHIKDLGKTFKRLRQEMGLEPRQEDAQLRTPIDLAVLRGHTGIVSLFSDKNRHASEKH